MSDVLFLDTREGHLFAICKVPMQLQHVQHGRLKHILTEVAIAQGAT